MKKIVLGLFVIMLSHEIIAQTISGKVIDAATKEGIPFSNVILQHNIKKVKFATSSDSLGNYNIKASIGEYTILISSIAYQTLSKKINIEGDGIFDFSLIPSEKKLTKVVVVAEKTTIEQLIDKKVINVGKDLLSAGGDASTILEQLAEIKIDPDGNLTLRGSQNVTVLLNGKRSGLSVAEFLKQIPASQIYKIEVITTPSAKYQANGLTGIINIITNKKIKSGISSSIDGNLNTLSGNGINTNTSYGTDNFGFKIGLNTNNPFFKSMGESERQGLLPFNQLTDFRFDGKINEINGAVDWYQSDKNIISYNFSYTNNTHNLKRDNKIFFDNINAKQLNKNYHKHTTFDNTLTYRHNFKENSFVQLDGRFSNNKNYLTSDFADNLIVSDNVNDNKIRIYDLSADYSTNLSRKIKLESGYSFNQIESRNMLTLFNSPTLYNLLESTNKEDVHAIFTTAQFDMGKWEIQAGFRGEQFKRNAFLKNTNEQVNLIYNNLFPSMHFIYKPNESNTWNFGFDRRTSRPSLDQVLTTVYQATPFIIDKGNPNLKPEFSNNFEITHRYNKSKFDVSNTFSFRKIENAIVNYASVEAGRESIRTYKNINGGNSFVFEFVLNLKLLKWMTNSISTNFIYQTFNTDGISFANSTGKSFTIQVSNQFVLNKKMYLTAQYSYDAEETSIFFRNKPYSQMQVGMRYKLKVAKSDASLGLRLTDVFNTLNTKYTLLGDGFNIDFYNKPTSRVLYLNFSINLGDIKDIKKADKKNKKFKSGTVG